MILARSLLFNVLFYVILVPHVLIAMLAMLVSQRAVMEAAKLWGRSNLWLLRWSCGIKVEVRGAEKIPQGPLIVAAKHQSVWETFALITLFRHPIYILKRELMWLPFFGWALWRGGMVAIDRGRGAQVIPAMIARAKAALAKNRQILIFPEGTRRPAGAEPRYKSGVAHLYVAANVPVVPVALNSGLFWPRRMFKRLPGTVVMEVLDPIPPGLTKDEFRVRLETELEAACTRLFEEGRRELVAEGLGAEFEALRAAALAAAAEKSTRG